MPIETRPLRLPSSAPWTGLFLCLAAPLLGGCVSELADDAPMDPTIVKEEIRVAERDQTGRLMISLDKRIGEYHYLNAQPGAQARDEREDVESLLRATVAQNLPLLLGKAGDAEKPLSQMIAVKALGFTADASAVAVLARTLEPTAEPRLLAAATLSLAQLASPSTPTEPLLDLSIHPDFDVRNNALLATWKVLDARVYSGASPLDPLEHERALSLFQTAMLEPEDAQVRAQAASALGSLRDARAVPPLVNLLHDRHPFVRTRTAIALAKIGDLSALRPLAAAVDSSAAGTPRSTVVMALTALVEATGRELPASMKPTSAAWERFIDERLADLAPR